MTGKKTAVLIILIIPAVFLAVLTGMFALLQSPSAVNKLAAWMEPITGLFVHVDDISFNRRLEARFRGLRIRTVAEKGFALSLAEGEVSAGSSSGLKVEVEKVLLTDAKFTFHIKKNKSETDPFAVLRKLPPVRLLEVKNGELELKSESAVYLLPGLDATIRDFKPDGGGTLTGRSRFDLHVRDMNAAGLLETSLDFSRFSPQPSGSGVLALSVETGSIGRMKLHDGKLTAAIKVNGNLLSLDGAKASILRLVPGSGSGEIPVRDITIQFNGSYDQKSSRFALSSFEGAGAGLGMVKGRASGTVKPLAWLMSLHATALDLSRIFGLASPFLPETYRNWTFKGTGSLEVESKGWYANGATLWNARAVAEINRGGFASADNSKAGERINGRIELKLESPGKGRQGGFTLTLEGGDGELLWEQYYQDFKGQKIQAFSWGAFTRSPFSLSSSGTLDFFQTGAYLFSADLSQNRSIFSLEADGVSCPRLFSTLLRSYISQNYPSLSDLTLEGKFDLKLTASLTPQRKKIEGSLELGNGAVRSPSNKLVLDGLNLSLPYDFALAGRPAPSTSGTYRQGSVSFACFEKGALKIGKVETPVILSANKFILPNPIHVSAFGAEIRLSGFKVENLFFPEIRAETGLTIRHLDMNNLIAGRTPLPFSATIDGDLSPITFQEGKWSSGGHLVSQVFGGRVTIENLFAGRLLSPSRFFGGDAVFDDIDLEMITAKIKVGRMTGLIQGSLKNFVMEYGQPSRFDLTITSDGSRKVSRQISVDAIKNLSIISTGSETISDILNSGLNRFFHEYPYSAIGIRCTLADDVFSLRGLIRQGGKEYLIRRGALRGIDMVNQNPDNAISFKDMAERVGRLFQPRQERKNVPSG